MDQLVQQEVLRQSVTDLSPRDKASMEIPSSHAGVVKEVKVAIGSKVKEGSIVLSLEVAGEVAASAPVPAPAATSTAAQAAAQTATPIQQL